MHASLTQLLQHTRVSFFLYILISGELGGNPVLIMTFRNHQRFLQPQLLTYLVTNGTPGFHWY